MLNRIDMDYYNYGFAGAITQNHSFMNKFSDYNWLS